MEDKKKAEEELAEKNKILEDIAESEAKWKETALRREEQAKV